MAISLTIVFILGYLAIALEHTIKLNKAASALLTGVFCWTIYLMSSPLPDEAATELLHHLADISSILFFLLGAMAIVELIDTHDGFDIVTSNIKATGKSTLLCIVTTLTFFLSALLDNLTTAIVMTSLCAKLLTEKEDRLWFTGMVIIAANAGGAWSPIGDITTTMLWIHGNITGLNIIVKTILPSIAVCAVPLSIVAFRFRGQKLQAVKPPASTSSNSYLILLLGIGLLIFVPVFKSITHLPPFMGMMLALGLMWIVTAVISPSDHDEKGDVVARALKEIDATSILFFLGILLAVSALQTAGILNELAAFLDDELKNVYLIGTALGLLSAIVDNVPLVAATMGMYDLSAYPTDHAFWEFLALTTGTGGSAIIIGSAAGVAAMGIEKISFMWYLKHISWLALLGFVAGIAVFIIQYTI